MPKPNQCDLLSTIFGGLPNCGCFYTGTNGAPMNKLLNMFSSTKFWVPDRLPQICYCFLLLLANITRRDMKINRCSFRKADDLMRWRPSATLLPSSPRPIQHPEVLPVLSSEVLLHVTPIHPDLQHHSWLHVSTLHWGVILCNITVRSKLQRLLIFLNLWACKINFTW